MKCAAALLALLPLLHAQEESAVTLLDEAGIGADREAIAAFLRSFHPEEELRRRVDAWVGRLAGPAGLERDEAMRRLAAMGASPLAALREARSGPDPETVRRALVLLRRVERLVSPSVLYAAMHVIRKRGYRGLVPEVMGTLSVTDDEHVVTAAFEAIARTATEDDLPYLRARIASDGPANQRAAAATAIARVRGAAALPELRELLRDAAGRVRLAAAWELCNAGDGAALPTLGALLESDDAAVRRASVGALRQVSGQTFGYSAVGHGDEAAMERWRGWIRDGGAKATWKTPLRRGRFRVGRILVSNYNANRVIEFDLSGRRTWQQSPVPRPWACSGTPAGHRLIATYSAKAVLEFDAEGKQVWRKDKLPGWPTSVQRLDNGNTLIAAGYSSDKVLEVRPDGSIAWEITVSGRPTYAQRLPSGRTLVTLQQSGMVVEIDRGGAVLWQIEGLKNPYGARRLQNGRTLVIEGNGQRVVEYTRGGQEIWKQEGLKNCCSADRLDDGRTLITDRTGVRLVDRGGEMLWLLREEGTLWACAY